MQPTPTFNLGHGQFFFIYRTLSVRQKTKNVGNQGSNDKKNLFFGKSP